jgi:hypothetical protein
MGSRRIGLARFEALLENLKRTLTLGTATISAAELSATTSGLLVSAGRIRESLEVADINDQNGVATVERIHKGLIVHTSNIGSGTITSDTAANIIAGHGGLAPLTANNQTISCFYINDGNQNVTFVAGSGVTLATTTITVPANGSCQLVFQRTGAAAVKMFMIGE